MPKKKDTAAAAPTRAKEPEPPTWAERVVAIMSRYGLTQTSLGKRLGVKQSVVGKWARGEQIPSGSPRKLLILMERGNDLADIESAE